MDRVRGIFQLYLLQKSKSNPEKNDYYAFSLATSLKSLNAGNALVSTNIYAESAGWELESLNKAIYSRAPLQKMYSTYAFKVTEDQVISYLNGKEIARFSTSRIRNLLGPMRISYTLEVPELGKTPQYYAWSKNGLKPEMSMKYLEFEPGNECRIS